MGLLVERAKQLDIIKNIILNPVLYSCTYGQDSDAELNIDKKEFLLVTLEGEPIGCFEIQEWTHKILEAHIFILPKYWKHSLDAVKAGENWSRENKYTAIFTKIPANCIHMLKFITRINYRACGLVHKGIIYNGQLTDLLLFEKQLYE